MAKKGFIGLTPAYVAHEGKTVGTRNFVTSILKKKNFQKFHGKLDTWPNIFFFFKMPTIVFTLNQF